MAPTGSPYGASRVIPIVVDADGDRAAAGPRRNSPSSAAIHPTLAGAQERCPANHRRMDVLASGLRLDGRHSGVAPAGGCGEREGGVFGTRLVHMRQSAFAGHSPAACSAVKALRNRSAL